MSDEKWTAGPDGEPKRIERPAREPFAHSPQLEKFAAAMAQANMKMRNAIKTKKNLHFGSDYADLAAVQVATVPVLAECGIAVNQYAIGTDGRTVTVITMFVHVESGQWVRSELTMVPTKTDPQGLVSATTYARRTALAAMACIAPTDEDDDGNEASEKPPAHEKPQGRRPHSSTGPDTSNHRDAPKEKESAEPAKPSDLYLTLYSSRLQITDGETPEVAGVALPTVDAWVAAVKKARDAKHLSAKEFDDLRAFHKAQNGEAHP